MKQLIQSIPLSVNEDIPRYIAFFETMINKGQLPKFPKFATTKNKVILLRDEKEEFEA